jgi:hypothetical protein
MCEIIRSLGKTFRRNDSKVVELYNRNYKHLGIGVRSNTTRRCTFKRIVNKENHCT